MPSTYALRDPADLLALVPYLLGFHPADSVVVLGLRDGAVVFQIRGDLGPAAELADYYAIVVGRQRVNAAIIVGYGPAAAVTAVVLAISARFATARIEVLDILRVTDDRFWSYLCTSLECCPPEGRRFDPGSSPVAAAAVVAGQVALPSRDALERRLAPAEGPARDAIRCATERADRRLCELVETTVVDPAGAVRAAGQVAVDAAVARHRMSGQLDDDELAWLTVLLVNLPVRDYAWESIGGDLTSDVRLWTEVLRRAEPDLVVAPATLLGFAAWRAGEGATASIAIARALHADPDYPLARILAEALVGGLSPHEWESERRRRSW